MFHKDEKKGQQSINIGVLCGVACAATVGTGCIVCLFAIDAISGATMGYCVGYANSRRC